MTRNLKLFLGAGALFFLIAAFNDAVGMYILAAAALAVVLTAYFLTRLHIRGVEAEIEMSRRRTRAGSTIDAVAKVRNMGRIRRTGMCLRLRVANETVPEGSYDYELPLPALPPRSVTELEIALDCNIRGRHRLGDLRLVAIDPMGVYHRWREFACSETFLGLPRMHTAGAISRGQMLSAAGRRAVPLLHRTESEFEGVRPHTPDDDLRMVHWKVTAHTDELMVRQYRCHHNPQITIWLDMWAENHPRGGEDSPTEVAVSLVATMLNSLVAQAHLVSVASQALPSSLALPSHGEAYLDRAVVALAQAQLAGRPSFSAFCHQQAHRTPYAGNVFAVTPAAEPGLVDALRVIGARGTHVTVLLVGGATDDDSELPERLRERNRELLARRLRGRGITCAQVDSFEDVPSVFARVAEQPGLGDAALETQLSGRE